MIFASCAQGSGKLNYIGGDDLNLKQFEITIYNSDYSMGYTLQYVLTEKDLKIIFIGGLEGEDDSTLFRVDIQPNVTLNKISNINLDSLQENYTNRCIEDGSQITVRLKKDSKIKMIHLSNYYQADIGLAIELINSLTPEKYKIWYDKKTLLNDQKNCK